MLSLKHTLGESVLLTQPDRYVYANLKQREVLNRDMVEEGQVQPFHSPHQWLHTNQMACHRCTDHFPDQTQHAKLSSKPMASGGHTKWYPWSQLAHTVLGLDVISGTMGTQLCFHLVWLATVEVDTQAEGREQCSDEAVDWWQGRIECGGRNDLQQIKCGRRDVCLLSRLNQQQEGDRDTEMVKQIASCRPAQSYDEMDRCNWEPLTLTTQREVSVLENR